MESTRTPKPMAVHGERVVADTLTVILKHHGYDCTPPYNGYDFVTLARQIRPQVILTDVVMLGMYGTEAAMLILDEQPECKIIFLATSTGADTLCQAVKQRVMITVVFKHGEMLRCGVQSQKKVTGLQIRIYLIVRNIAQPFFLRTRILVLQCESRSTPLNHYLSS
jgi:CheY-like chemotaxis protein